MAKRLEVGFPKRQRSGALKIEQPSPSFREDQLSSVSSPIPTRKGADTSADHLCNSDAHDYRDRESRQDSDTLMLLVEAAREVEGIRSPDDSKETSMINFSVKAKTQEESKALQAKYSAFFPPSRPAEKHFECVTCGRRLPSSKALGGHRSSCLKKLRQQCPDASISQNLSNVQHEISHSSSATADESSMRYHNSSIRRSRYSSGQMFGGHKKRSHAVSASPSLSLHLCAALDTHKPSTFVNNNNRSSALRNDNSSNEYLQSSLNDSSAAAATVSVQVEVKAALHVEVTEHPEGKPSPKKRLRLPDLNLTPPLSEEEFSDSIDTN